MEALEDEKRALEGQVTRAGSLMAAMQSELSSIHSEVDQQKRSASVSLSPSKAATATLRNSPHSHHSTILSHMSGSVAAGGGSTQTTPSRWSSRR